MSSQENEQDFFFHHKFHRIHCFHISGLTWLAVSPSEYSSSVKPSVPKTLFACQVPDVTLPVAALDLQAGANELALCNYIAQRRHQLCGLGEFHQPATRACGSELRKEGVHQRPQPKC